MLILLCSKFERCDVLAWPRRGLRKVLFHARCVAVVLGVLLAPIGQAAIAVDGQSFDGSRWRVVGLNGENVGMAGDLHFDGPRVDGATSCNFFGARATFSGKSGLAFDLDRMTRKACSGEAFKLEKDYTEALRKVRKYVLSGDSLRLLDEEGGEVLLLTRKPLFDLEGTDLKIVSYLKDGGLYSVKPGTMPTLRFEKGRLKGEAECMSYKGSYKIEGSTIAVKIEDTSVTDTDCEADLMEQERAIIANFEQAVRFDRGRNIIRLLQAENDWAVLWLAQNTN